MSESGVRVQSGEIPQIHYVTTCDVTKKPEGHVEQLPLLRGELLWPFPAPGGETADTGDVRLE